MASKAALAVALLMAASLAGCAGDDGGEGSSTTSSTGSRITYSATPPPTTSSSGTSTSASSTSTSSQANRAPTATISVAVNGTNATFTLGGEDPDDDAIVWDLDFGDGNRTNGTTLPATVTHAYAGGNYTAAFGVTDGVDRTAKETAVSIVAAGGSFPVVFTETAVLPCPSCTFNPVTNNCGSWQSGQSGVDCVVFALLPEHAGHPFHAISVSTGAGADVGVEIFDSCDAAAANSLLFDDDGADEAGTIPAGAACAVIWSFTDPNAAITLTIS